ncbi:two-component system regulatory protein YycI [Metabacillus sp. 84]|uniref:two-component system regulatory protein YycI n=1 Tax=unclassified Metabacillus TaxID=2675274 RepID=UPI003CEAC8A0
MDWSKTKTIFIFAFLVLDLFLAWQYSQKVVTSEYDSIQVESIQDQLSAEEITYPPLPADVSKVDLLSVKRHLFTPEEAAALKEQEPVFDLSEKKPEPVLQMELKSPIPVKKEDIQKADELVSAKLLFGDQYVYWSFDEEKGMITYLQQVDGKTLYQKLTKQPIGVIKLHLNDQSEIINYEQTYVEATAEEQQQDTLSATKAVSQLYSENDLKPKSSITKIDLGYYTEQEFSEQSLQPYWYIEINDKEDYFVNAFDGQIVRPNQE